MRPAIRVEKLSKRYQIGIRPKLGSRNLTEVLTDGLNGLWRSVTGRGAGSNGDDGTLWALKELSFEVQPGEVLGIIGRNGAGKSTLLKILSRIVEPTSGRMEYRGRIASLLEVGTGFHPELTGRENVYLSGSINGMKMVEIDRKFDEIIDFAGIAKFLDTPVKRYSSGMYVRLAFAVAAHLYSDILLVDEVLAVGDAAYQTRCLDRMAEMTRSGKTVLFVTHGLDLVQKLCKKVIQLDKGEIRSIGPATKVVEQYLASQMDEIRCRERSEMAKTGEGGAQFTDLQLVDEHGNPRAVHVSGEDLILRVEITADCDIHDASIDVNISTLSGVIFTSGWTDEVDFPVTLRRGAQAFLCRFRNMNLRPGCRIMVALWLASQGDNLDYIERARVIDIVEGAETARLLSSQPGIVIYNYSWSRLDPQESIEKVVEARSL